MHLLTVFLQIHAEAARPFERPIMTNIHRADYVEAIVGVALADTGWRRMTPWDSWDFEHTQSKCRLEVKQSAAAQSWGTVRASPARFDTAPRTGYWNEDEQRFIRGTRCHAHIYVFAWHDHGEDAADQRDPTQWEFYVISEHDLPNQKSIGLSIIRGMASPITFADLAAAVDTVRDRIGTTVS